MKNKLRKKVKARSKFKYLKSYHKTLKKFPELKESLDGFWKELKETKPNFKIY